MNPSIPNQYDPANAAFLAYFAAAAYQPHIEFADFKTAVIASRATDTRALVACDGEDCVVAFRGTQDLRNWLTDLDCAFVRLGKLRIHRGFYEALKSVREELRAELEALPYRRLWLTGHSLGGALAMLAAHSWEGAVEGVYTFGQPRAGDAAFAREYNDRLRERTFRVIRANDLVPRVPWLLGAYRHAGHEIFVPFPPGTGSQKPSPKGGNTSAISTSLAPRILERGESRREGPFISKIHPGHFISERLLSSILLWGRGKWKPSLPEPLSFSSPPANEDFPKIKGGDNWMQDRNALSKLPWDIYNTIRELRRGELALLDDHHISRYLALFPPQTECCFTRTF